MPLSSSTLEGLFLLAHAICLSVLVSAVTLNTCFFYTILSVSKAADQKEVTIEERITKVKSGDWQKKK